MNTTRSLAAILAALSRPMDLPIEGFITRFVAATDFDVSGLPVTANGSTAFTGITVTVDALTRIEDKSSTDVDLLNPTYINAGDYVEVRGGEAPAGSGTVLATILECKDADADAILQGFVEAVGGFLQSGWRELSGEGQGHRGLGYDNSCH